MRIVVDTNVFVSAVLKHNSLPFLVVRWIDDHGGPQPPDFGGTIHSRLHQDQTAGF